MLILKWTFFFDTSVGSAVSHLHLRKSFSYKAILHMLWSKYEYISQYLLICHFPLNSNQHKHSQDESILINFSKSRLVFCESVYIFVWFYFIILGFEVFHFYPELHYFIHLQGFWLLYIIYFRIFFSIYIQPLFSFFFNVFFFVLYVFKVVLLYYIFISLLAHQSSVEGFNPHNIKHTKAQTLICKVVSSE